MKEIFVWEAPEYAHNHKHVDWFWALGIIALSGAVASVVFGNILLAVLILLSAAVMALYAARTPDTITFSLSEKGFTINDTHHPYRTLDSFWVHEPQAGTPQLIIKSKHVLSPLYFAPLADELDPDDLREFLLTKLKEEEHEESITQKLMEFFGF